MLGLRRPRRSGPSSRRWWRRTAPGSTPRGPRSARRTSGARSAPAARRRRPSSPGSPCSRSSWPSRRSAAGDATAPAHSTLVAQAASRRSTITRPPRPGIIVTLRWRGCSGARSGARRSVRRAIALEHDPLLGHRQRRPEAAADPAAEREPGVGPGLDVRGTARGGTLNGSLVDVLAVVHGGDAHRHRRPGAARRTRRAASGRLTPRTIIGITGRIRIPSWIVAST